MQTLGAHINAHPVLSYCALTFASSWGGVLVVSGPGGVASATWHSNSGVALLGLALLAGPSLASVLLTVVVDGRAGLRTLLARLLTRGEWAFAGTSSRC